MLMEFWNSRAHKTSLSLRRAWIEMVVEVVSPVVSSGRSPYGERGLKYDDDSVTLDYVPVALLTESVD